MYIKELELPELELVDPNADYNGTQTIFIDFDGANGVSYDNNALNIYIDNLSVAHSGLSEEEQFQIITDLNHTFADTGVTFTVSTPTNEEYSTIYVGGNGSSFSEYGSFLGLSETIDAGNQIKNDEAFVFSDNIDSVATITETVAHEAGHLLGFKHANHSHVSIDSFASVNIIQMLTHEELENFTFELKNSSGGTFLNDNCWAPAGTDDYGLFNTGEHILLNGYATVVGERILYDYSDRVDLYEDVIKLIVSEAETAPQIGSYIEAYGLGTIPELQSELSNIETIISSGSQAGVDHFFHAGNFNKASNFQRILDHTENVKNNPAAKKLEILSAFIEGAMLLDDISSLGFYSGFYMAFQTDLALNALNTLKQISINDSAYTEAINRVENSLRSLNTKEDWKEFSVEIDKKKDEIYSGSVKLAGAIIGIVTSLNPLASATMTAIMMTYELCSEANKMWENYRRASLSANIFDAIHATNIDDNIENYTFARAQAAYYYYMYDADNREKEYDDYHGMVTRAIDAEKNSWDAGELSGVVASIDDDNTGGESGDSGDTIIVGTGSITIQAPNNAYTSGEPFAITVTVKDTNNNPISGQSVSVSRSSSTMGGWTDSIGNSSGNTSNYSGGVTNSNGQFIQYYLPAQYGDMNFTVNTGSKSSSVTVKAIADPNVNISILPSIREVTESGASYRIVVDFTYQNGAPVSNDTVLYTASDNYTTFTSGTQDDDIIKDISNYGSSSVTLYVTQNGNVQFTAKHVESGAEKTISFNVSLDAVPVVEATKIPTLAGGIITAFDIGTNYLAVNEYDKGLTVWDTETWVVKNHFEHEFFGTDGWLDNWNSNNDNNYVGFSYDDRYITIGNNDAFALFDRTNNTGFYEDESIYEPDNDNDIQPNGTYWVSCDDEERLVLLNKTSFVKIIDSGYRCESVEWSKTGTYIAALNEIQMTGPDPNYLSIYRSSGTIYSRTQIGAGEILEDLTWSPNSDKVAVSIGESIKIYSINGSELKTISSSNEVTSIAWSPDDKYIACLLAGSSNGYIYNVSTGLKVATIKGVVGDNGYRDMLSWSPDSKYIYAASRNATSLSVFSPFDSDDPVFSNISLTDNETVLAETITISGNINDNFDLFPHMTMSDFEVDKKYVRVIVNSGDDIWLDIDDSGSFSYNTTLQEGVNTIELNASDFAGNTAEKTYTINYQTPDIQAPDVPEYLSMSSEGYAVTLDWGDCTDDKTEVKEYKVQYSIDVSFTNPSEHVTTESEIILNKFADLSTYYWRVNAKDNSENESSWSDTVSFSTDFPDSIAPDIPAGQSFEAIGDDITLNWTVATDNKSGIKEYFVAYSTDSNFDDYTGSFISTNSLTISDLNEAQYYWIVKAIDNAGNVSDWSTANSFSIDTTAPTVTDGLQYTNNVDSVKLEWLASFDEGVGVKEYLLEYSINSDFTNSNTQVSTNSFIELSGLIDLTKYYWRIKSVDNNNNQSSWSETSNFTVDIPDIMGPSTPSVLTHGVTGNSVVFDWVDSTDNKSGVKEYIVEYADNYMFSDSVLKTVTESEYSIDDLPYGIYHWRVSAVDYAGNESSRKLSMVHVMPDDQYKLIEESSSQGGRFANTVVIDGDTIVTSGNSVYAYKLSGDSWIGGKINDSIFNANWSEHLDISGDIIVAGESTNNKINIYEWNGNIWDASSITPSDITEYDGFGRSVAASGNMIVASAIGDDDNGSNSGSVYLYQLNEGEWLEEKIIASDGESGDNFGWSVDAEANTIVVGAIGDIDNAGNVYVYKRNDTEWQESKITASDAAAGDSFGYSVAVDDNIVVVGAYGYISQGTKTGSAYIYRWDGDDWQETKITASDAVAGNFFGCSVDISGDTVVVGAFGSDDNGLNSGSAYIYQWNGSDWLETEFNAYDNSEGDFFGRSVSIDGNNITVGSQGNDGYCVNSGSAYIFDLDEIDGIYDTQAPTMPTGLLQTASEGSVALDWADSSDADSGMKQYNIQVDNNEDFSSLEYSGSVVDSTLSLTELVNGAYFWRVQAKDNAGNASEWSNGTNFLFNDGAGGDSNYELFYGHFSGGSTDEIIKFDTDSHELEISRNGIFETLAETGSGWSVAATGDLNGDGCDDILLANEEFNALGAWTMNEDGSYGWMNVGSLPMPEWQVESVVDLDGNGVDDMLLYWEEFNYYGAWLLDDGGNISWRGFGQIADGWEIGGTGDFNGDNREDLYLVNAEYGAVGTWLMNEDANGISWQTIGAYNSNIWSIEGAGDFDGNGVDDLLLKWDDLNYLGAWQLDGLGNISGWASFGQYEASSWDLSGIADVNGDGTDDILMGAAGSDYIGARLLNDGAVNGWMTIAS